MPLTPDDIGKAEPEPKVPKGRRIPYMPDREASFSDIRQWLSTAIGLPDKVRVDAVTRFGRGEDDALAIMLSNDMVIRCDRQRRLLTPGGLQSFFASESDGLCRTQYLSKAECGEVYIVLCALATAAAEQDELSELRERLEGFVQMCEPVHGSLQPEYRYSTLRRLQAREEYDRAAASDIKKGRSATRPVVVADHEWAGGDGTVYLVRHSEFITQLRVVHMQTIADNFLKGRMAELGCTYHALQSHGPGRRGHAALAFYELPHNMAVPHSADNGRD